MKIKRVELKNYRSHTSGDFTFDRGINLLLGKNGAGKSSILEAAGHALFDADLRSTAADAVTRGHKTATIRVTFEGGDGNDYIIERKIGASSSVRLYRQGEKSCRSEGKDAVLHKVRHLAGIAANEKNLFQNVITAYQNKIVDIFCGTASAREDTFNQIFDTAIYRQMFEGFAKDAVSAYKSELAARTGAGELLGGRIRDTADLKKNLLARQAAAQEEESRLAVQKKEMAALDARRERQEQAMHQMDALRADIRHRQELTVARQQEKAKTQEAMTLSQQAQRVVADNEQIYVMYCNNINKLKELAVAIEALERKQAERDARKERLGRLTADIEACQASRRHLEALLADKQRAAEKIAADAAVLTQDFERLQRELEELTRKGSAHRELEAAFLQQYDLWRKHQESIAVLAEKIADFEKKPFDRERLTGELRALQQHKEALAATREQKQGLERAIGEIDTRLTDLAEAQDKLSGGMCPFLHEQCRNMQSGTSPEQYFSGRRQAFGEQRAELAGQLAAYDDIDKLISQADGDIARIEGDLQRADADVRSAAAYRAALDAACKDAEIAGLTIKNILSPMAPELGRELAEGSFEGVAHRLTDILTTLREQFKHQQAQAAEAEKHLAGRREELRTAEKQVADAGAELQALAERNAGLEQELAQVNVAIETLDAELAGLAGLRQERKELDAELAGLKPGYDLYVGSRQKAADLDLHRQHVRALEHELTALAQGEQEAAQKLAACAAAFSEEGYQKLIAAIADKKAAKDALQDVVARLQTEIALARKDLDENLQREQEYRDLQARISQLSRKLELAEKFRASLGGMGKFVASRLMEAIEAAATENFRRITGRSDEIRWVNDEKESYAVFLANGPDAEHRKRFEMLSGGEQVSVALSLRAAMAAALTRANFAIFDEPTINLDAEKKTALAESLQGMLRNLSQAIIVTHDDTFREMAQKIICLD